MDSAAPALTSIVPSIAILGVAAVAALFLTVSRGWSAGFESHRRATVRLAGITILAQTAHFIEELLSGFQVRFPEVFGLPPMSRSFFVVFNAGWLLVWIASCAGLAARRREAMFPLWFLAIAGTANGVAHPLMAASTGAYFPGLATSPVVGVLGLLLLRRLALLTQPDSR